MRSGTLFHFGLRSRCSIRWSLVAAGMGGRLPPALTGRSGGASVRG
jgi:hypothetical protein